MTTHTITNGDPFRLEIEGASVIGGTVCAPVVGPPPDDGQSYARSGDSWVLVAGGTVTRHEGAGSGTQTIATIPYGEGDGPDFYQVDLVANLTGSTSRVGSFVLIGSAGRDAAGVSSPFTALRADSIPRQQSLAMSFVGSNLVIRLNNSNATDLEWSATVRRKRKSEF